MPDDHYYLGYNLDGCEELTVVPHAERGNAINILAKQIEYFYFEDSWNVSYYAKIKEATGFELISVARHENNDSIEGIPAGLTSLGKLTKLDYGHMVVRPLSLILYPHIDTPLTRLNRCVGEYKSDAGDWIPLHFPISIYILASISPLHPCKPRKTHSIFYSA